MKTNRDKILCITRTGILIALLVTLQWLTAPTSAFAGQFITGSCVNAVLAVSVLATGLWSGVAVAIVSPFCAFLLGIGPKLIQIVPAIAMGNLVLVVILHLIAGRDAAFWKSMLGVIVAASAKFGALYLLVVKLVIPVMGDSLAEKQVATFTAMFSWPQLVTALIGGTVAAIIVPVIRKALRK